MARLRKETEKQRLKAMTAAAPERTSKVVMVLSKDGAGMTPSISNLNRREVIDEEDTYTALP